MAKVSAETWEKAEALRKAGKSYREIGSALNIPTTTLLDRSKRGDWDSNKTEHLIADAVRVEKEIRTLKPEHSKVVRDEVAKQLEHIQFFNNAAITNVKQAMAKPCENQNDFRARAETINKGRESVLGKSPDTAIQINNGGDNKAVEVHFVGS